MGGGRLKIIITGFMGTGKSTAGRILARGLGVDFLETDDIIEKRAGIPIREIFEEFGEARFRDMEREVLMDLMADGGAASVVSTGGGMVKDPANRALLREAGTVVCLTALPAEILRRVGGCGARPLLNVPDPAMEIARLLKEREAAYADCDLVIDTTGKAPAEVAGEIRRRLKI